MMHKTFRNAIKLFTLFFLLVSHSALQASNELLPPEKAFALSAHIENDQVITNIDIAEGYYVYRDSFSFTIDTDNAEFGSPSATDGIMKNDEFFGEKEVYYNNAQIILPLVYTGSTKADEIVIKTTLQGCAEIGVCYPPLNQSLTMNTASSATVLPVAYQAQPKTETNNISEDGLQSMNDILSGLTETLNAQTVTDTVEKVTDTVAPIVEPIVQPISSALQSDEKPQEKEPEKSSSTLDLLQALGSDLGLNQEDEIPSPDDAFRLSADMGDNSIVKMSIAIHPSTYLYKDKMKISIIDGKGHELGAVSLPKGDQKHDEFFGDIVVFHHQFDTAIPIITEVGASSQLVISLGYQGCVEDKICYPPITKFLLVDTNAKTVSISDEQPSINQEITQNASVVETIRIANPEDQQTFVAPSEVKNTTTLANNSPSTTSTSVESAPQTEQDRFANIIAGDSLWVIIASFFFAGLLLTFTPCVFPMIPILSGIIAGQGENITTKKAFSLSLVYVLAMASTYAVAGAIVGYYGAEYNIQAWFQDPVILSIFAAIFVLLALSMFGFYDIQMPSFIQSRLTEFSNKQAGGDLVGVGIMGLLSALIVGPCITAPLVGALIFISQTQDWLLGGIALFALGIGMGTPLLLIGTSAGKFLPRAGTWMDAVKAVFGVSLLAVAIWLLERILPSEVIMVLIAVLLIIYGVYITSAPIKEGMSGWARIGRGIGFIFILYGSFYLIGMAAGGKDLVQPLKGIIQVSSSSGGSSTDSGHLAFQPIKGVKGLEQALEQHKGKFVMLDFYADWCISCKEMEKYAFTHPKVLAALKDVAVLQTDVTANDSEDGKFMKSINIYGPPAILFYDKSGNEIPNSRVVGEMSGEEFAAHVERVLSI